MKKLLILLCTIASPGCHKDEALRANGDCVEKDPGDRACYEIYKPVCGCNGKTYPNDCFAEIVGITEYTQGPCEPGK